MHNYPYQATKNICPQQRQNLLLLSTDKVAEEQSSCDAEIIGKKSHQVKQKEHK